VEWQKKTGRKGQKPETIQSDRAKLSYAARTNHGESKILTGAWVKLGSREKHITERQKKRRKKERKTSRPLQEERSIRRKRENKQKGKESLANLEGGPSIFPATINDKRKRSIWFIKNIKRDARQD